ncbi:chromodomain-helicase-DNA-binding protein 8-like [Schistocerca gregaria]|uniref:chromodomain-helicase-DNA-binding protein 8-like n=1 Tax=Schistocerca gregaria TaxID=7010 RepID=UPI00211DD7C6|nr:chromodomain-helicase-DNA-binding protein 8-like [Schistocerca gregaria]
MYQPDYLNKENPAWQSFSGEVLSPPLYSPTSVPSPLPNSAGLMLNNLSPSSGVISLPAESEIVVKRGRGRPRKHFHNQAPSVRTPANGRTVRRHPKKSKRRAYDSDDELTEDSNENKSHVVNSRIFERRNSNNRHDYPEDGDPDSEYSLMDYEVSNQQPPTKRVSLRQRKRHNYSENNDSDSLINEEEEFVCRKKVNNRSSSNVTRNCVTDVLKSEQANAEDSAEDGEGEDEATNSAANKSGLSKEMRLKSTQIEKILAYRIVSSKPVNSAAPSEHQNGLASVNNTEDKEIQYEYYVKYKQRSYIHCEWLPQAVVENAKLGKQRLQRFLNKDPVLDPDPPFEPEYTEVDRILACEEQNGQTYYYVKWQGLPYNESTWEPADLIKDTARLQEFKEHNTIPTIKPDSSLSAARSLPVLWNDIPNIEFKDGNQLRPYQLEGMKWLCCCWYNRRNSILADEMGLGKTVQTISVLWYLYRWLNIYGPFLIIAPLSTILHWRREVETWTTMNCLVYHGNSEARQIIRDYEWNYTDEKGNIKSSKIFKFHIIITTYEMVLTDTEVLSPIRWKYIAIDEAHRLKNKSSRLLNEFRHFKYDHLLLLTGTPIQNNTQELWTLINLLDPVQFNSLDAFIEEFGDLKDAEQVKRLHTLLRPFLLRRMKEDVEKSIAPKEETIIEVELTTIQKKYYRAVLERSFDNLVQGSKSRSSLPSLLNIMMQLRKCCNHPYLLKGVEETELGVVHMEQNTTNESLIESSGKLVLIDKLLPRLKSEGHKILIFSQMVRVLDILEDYLKYRGHKYERIDGTVRGNDRQAAIDRFSRPGSDIFVFLLCTRAGGVGINLTAADTVIIFDSDWNPQNDLQAQARCHRIGQQKSVQVYRLLTRGTYERVLFERASLKLGLNQAVLSRMNDGNTVIEDDDNRSKFSSSEVDTLLKHGVYDLFRGDNTYERFREENIEDILSKRTMCVVHDSSNLSGSSFSKATFASEQANMDLDVNDPDFWKKVMPSQPLRSSFNSLTEPRQRRSVQRPDVKEGLNSSDSEIVSESDEVNADITDDDDAYTEADGNRRRDVPMSVGKLVRLNRQKKDGERYRKPSGPIFQKRKWNMTQRNRFVRAIQLLGFGRWREIKRNAKLCTKSLKELVYYGRAYLHKLVSFSALGDGDTEDKVISRIINCDDNIEDITEDPWYSPSKRQMLAYSLHKKEAEAGVPLHLIEAAEKRYKARVEQEELFRARDKKILEAKRELLLTNKLLDQPMGVDTIEMGGLPPSGPGRSYLDFIEESSHAPNDESIVIYWHLNNKEEMKQEVSYFCNEDPMLNEPRFLENMKSTATQTIKRLELLAEVGALVRSNFGEFAADTFPKIEGGDPTFFDEKWTAQHDRDLLVGTWKWGFGQYDKIARDPVLSYFGIYKPKPIKERSKNGEEDDDIKDVDMDEDEDRPKKDYKKEDEHKSSSDFLDDNNDADGYRDDSGALENEGDAVSNNNFLPSTQEDVAQSPLPAAAEHADDSLSTAPAAKDGAPKEYLAFPGFPIDESKLLSMPPSKLLTHRVKHLIKAFAHMRRKRTQNEQKEKKRLEKEREKEEKQKRKEDKEASWSKRERNDFYRSIQIYGAPCAANNSAGNSQDGWSFIYKKACLTNKSFEAIQKYYLDFIAVCCYLLNSKQTNQRVSRRTVAEDDYEDILGSSELDCAQLTGITDPDQLPQYTDAELEAKAEYLRLTVSQAKRVCERICMFNALRRNVTVLPEQEILDRINGCALTGFGLPSWWNHPKFDFSLLVGVGKHGFSRWDKLCADRDLEFYEVAKCFFEENGLNTFFSSSKQGINSQSDRGDDSLDADYKRDVDDDMKAIYSQIMPPERVLWKRLLYLIRTIIDSNSSSSASRPSKKRQLTLNVCPPSDDGDEQEKEPHNEVEFADPGCSTSSDKYEPTAPSDSIFRIPDDIPIDRDLENNVLFPIYVPNLISIHSLGKMVGHSSPASPDTPIYPIGFTSYREYFSCTTPNIRSIYVCEILSSDDLCPIFRITSKDDSTCFAEAPDIQQVWDMTLARIRTQMPDFPITTCLSGADFFGLSCPKIAELIDSLPSAEKRQPSASSPVRSRASEFSRHQTAVDDSTASEARCGSATASQREKQNCHDGLGRIDTDSFDCNDEGITPVCESAASPPHSKSGTLSKRRNLAVRKNPKTFAHAWSANDRDSAYSE